jgi:hypothetical protein
MTLSMPSTTSIAVNVTKAMIHSMNMLPWQLPARPSVQEHPVWSWRASA